MKTYMTPEIDLTVFATEDIVRTSIIKNEAGIDDDMTGIWNPQV